MIFTTDWRACCSSVLRICAYIMEFQRDIFPHPFQMGEGPCPTQHFLSRAAQHLLTYINQPPDKQSQKKKKATHTPRKNNEMKASVLEPLFYQ
ncbi:hypothetical protein, unlikely [Trypanosoma brucei gambiense DAL972]|uniref:Uncharacterized protein n=1 Tax=Trypanosoma brucei gambiense (strain MHOM/CI/86/DAL972) TaxID=679716 RepID=C9ZIS5_TRYB9|nr:hypothetical protein, unlikely [Trypanosoma brucei gambiense DAL972]CBH09067.1 hypothetical protein, unlikely [Trypanosoma brucei gambiense DAL972]|eukprot:XP_011771508.1 hypothetical protein, unlikely [Trypanosoma brucei gambiense DAL972]